MNSICNSGTNNITLGNKEAAKIINPTKYKSGNYDPSSSFNNGKIVPGVLKGSFIDIFNAASINHAYTTYVANILTDRFNSSTAVEKMYLCAQTFLYNLAYNVEGATFIPYMPTLSSKYIWREIKPSDYAVIRSQVFIPPQIAGVGIYGQQSFDSAQAPNSSPDRQYIIGAYKASDHGKFLMLDAPKYLLPRAADGANRGTASAPNAIGSAPPAAAAPAVTEAMSTAINRVGCAYAKYKYFDTIYSMRTGAISGKLRFDIAPGSAIKLIGAKISVPSTTTVNLYATVAGVTIIIDAQDGQAMTNLSLSHLRTEDENKDSPEVHPFFDKETWVGSPLVVLNSSSLKPEKNGT
jgi:hypothetical protein